MLYYWDIVTFKGTTGKLYNLALYSKIRIIYRANDVILLNDN